MSGNVNLNWTLPTTYEDGSPMTVQHVRVEAQVQGASSWTEINTVTPDQTSLLIENLAGGTWLFRGIVVPTQGQESDPLGASVDVPFGKASALATFDATLA